MSTAGLLEHVFPEGADIPEQYRLGEVIEQREYLVNGALQIWEGPLASARS